METSTLKEIEGGLPKKNNAKYIRAMDDDGNPIYISKEDLASVVGGLLPEATKDSKGLMSKEDKRASLIFYDAGQVAGFVKIIKNIPESCNLIFSLIKKQKSADVYSECEVAAVRHPSNENNKLRASCIQNIGNFNVYLDRTDNSILFKVEAYTFVSISLKLRTANCPAIECEFLASLPESAESI